MAYTVFLDDVQMPVAPAKIQMKINNQNKTVNLINNGEVNILKTAGLTEISFDVLIPQVKYPFADYPDGFKEARYYLGKFKQMKVSRKPFAFKCLRVAPDGSPLFETNMTVSLEDYSISEDADDGIDLTVSLKLKQYRSYGTRIVKIIQSDQETAIATTSEERPAESAPQPKTYTVLSGDCLWNIAKKYLGDGARYPEIYNLNKDKIKNPNLIYPGQVLTLP